MAIKNSYKEWYNKNDKVHITTKRQLQKLKISAKRCNMTKNRFKQTMKDANNYKKSQIST